MRMAAVWAVQSVRPKPRRPGWEGLWVRGFARACSMIQGREIFSAPMAVISELISRSQRSFQNIAD
jgi:hypothetical protein